MARAPEFGRVLKLQKNPMVGRDVLAVERCLHRHGYMWKDPDQTFGWRTRDSIEFFQRRHNQKPDGVYDEPVHAYLGPLFDDYEEWLYTNAAVVPKPPAEDSARDRLMHALWTLYAQAPWTYHPVRPFILYPLGRHISYAFDCSWMVTQTFYMAGLPDPNGLSYRGGIGNTESLRAHGTRVYNAEPGDLLFYGYYGSRLDPAHVAMSHGNDMGIGFGSSGGPRNLPEGYRTLREIRSYV